MLPIVDDVDAPQRLWDLHGKSMQRYGVPSPRLRREVTDQEIWDAFILVMGTRIGIPTDADPGAAPPVPTGSTMQSVIAERIREFSKSQGVDLDRFDTDEIMNIQQYNLFPNMTLLVYPDLVQVLRARPGATPDDAFLDGFFFERHAPEDPAPRARPLDVTLAPGEADFGLVLNQDFALLQRVQRGLHQPGLTHLTLSSEECRVINFHRNLDRMLGAATFDAAPFPDPCEGSSTYSSFGPGEGVDESGDRREQEHQCRAERDVGSLLGPLPEDAEAVRRQQQTAEGLTAEERVDLAAERLRLALERERGRSVRCGHGGRIGAAPAGRGRLRSTPSRSCHR